MMQSRLKMPRLDNGQYDMAFKVLVSPHAAGKIIGRGGQEIAELRKQLGVGCHIHGPENLFPNTGCQVAVLFGSRANIDLSFEMLVNKMAEAEAETVQQSQQLMVAVVMTTNAVSAVIGTKGATIATLRQQVGCGFSADKELYQGEQIVRVTGPVERLAAALALLTPFVERSGDSLQYAMQEYSSVGCWEGGWMPRPMLGPMPQKGMGKRMAPPWAMGPQFQVGPGAPILPAKRRALSPMSWVPQKQARPAGPVNMGIMGEMEANTWAMGSPEQEAMPPMVGVAPLEGVMFEGDDTPAEDDPRVLGCPSTIAFPIPKDAIGRVLGRGGASSAEIRRATGAALQIDPGEVDGTVTLSGTLAAVQRAHRMVIARVLASS
mmetsp:Transcript_44609/g.103140  ORF Transcript_44609/g.103140 Transcript_44609/m.103140 type:complete len:377 (+) Transcript_44609:45-1175(+)